MHTFRNRKNQPIRSKIKKHVRTKIYRFCAYCGKKISSSSEKDEKRHKKSQQHDKKCKGYRQVGELLLLSPGHKKLAELFAETDVNLCKYKR